MQRRFVSGKFTSPVLVGVSLLLWLVGFFFSDNECSMRFMGHELGVLISNGVALLCFAVSSLVVSSCYLFERRAKWLSSLMFALSGVSIFVHVDLTAAFSLLLFAVALSYLFSCQQGEDNRNRLFTLSALLGVAMLFFPCFITLLPALLFYVTASKGINTKELLALMLGVVTPLWFQFGITYIYPAAVELFNPIGAPVQYLLSASAVKQPSLLHGLVLLLDIFVVIPFVSMFAGSSVPAKPFLRRRLQFIAVLDIYLLLVSLLYQNEFNIYYAWALPLKGVMLAYIYHLPVTRFSRIYFIFINIIWLLLMPFCLWLRH